MVQGRVGLKICPFKLLVIIAVTTFVSVAIMIPENRMIVRVILSIDFIYLIILILSYRRIDGIKTA